MRRRSSPILASAVEFLRDTVKSGIADRHRRLPTVAQLSKRAGVSSFTMCKAVARLKEEGVLSARQGRWVEIAPADVPVAGPSPTEKPMEAWQEVARALQDDILQGVYIAGAVLPPAKELMRRHGVCYRTIRKSLLSLTRDRAIRRDRKSYRVAAMRPGKNSSTIVLVATGDAAGNLDHFTPRAQDQLRQLEAECSRMEIDLQVVTADRDTGSAFLHGKKVVLPRLPLGAKALLGFVVWRWTDNGTQFADFVSTLSRLGRPVSILDAGGLPAMPTPAMGHGLVRYFTIANSATAAYKVGRYLLGNGHRRVAYISPFNSPQWSRNRFEGLVAAFADAGLGDAVSSFTKDQWGYVAEYVSQTRAIHAMVDDMLKSREIRHDPTHPLMLRTLAALQSRISAIEQETIVTESTALFEQALSRHNITAWVCANDDTAIEALAYLAKKGKRVPDEISVIGFDDGVSAFLRKLTSYNFNTPAVVRAMVSHILDRHAAARKKGPGEPIEIEGFVTQRSTVSSIKVR
jgi:DNA-binding LacI/PurR family transcriptional regulator/DNA-binding FadR family transcriptional regulator